MEIVCGPPPLDARMDRDRVLVAGVATSAFPPGVVADNVSTTAARHGANVQGAVCSNRLTRTFHSQPSTLKVIDVGLSLLQLQSIPSFIEPVVNSVTRLKCAPLVCAPSLQQDPVVLGR